MAGSTDAVSLRAPLSVMLFSTSSALASTSVTAAAAMLAHESSSSTPQRKESGGLSFSVGMALGLAASLSALHPLVHRIADFLSHLPHPASQPDASISRSLYSAIIPSDSSSLVNATTATFITSAASVSSSISNSPQSFLSSASPSFLLTISPLSVLLAVLLLSLVYLYHVVTRPLLFTRPLTPEQRATALRKSYTDMPPPFPNSWYKLCDEFDLFSGQPPVSVEALGRLFSVRREVDGTVVCVDKKEARLWETCEVNRIVFVWYDEQGRSSAWQVPQAVPAEELKGWRFAGRTAHEIICHIQEIPENGADTAHLDYLHGDFILDQMTAAKHTWQATWTPQPYPNIHIAKISVDTAMTLFGHRIPFSLVQTRISQVGPGVVQLIFPTPFGRILMQDCITPVTSNVQRSSHVLYMESSVPRVVSKFIFKATLIQFERDFSVWNNKRWVRAPMAVKEDGPILKYRRWMKQFYDRDGGQLLRDYEGNEKVVEKAVNEY